MALLQRLNRPAFATLVGLGLAIGMTVLKLNVEEVGQQSPFLLWSAAVALAAWYGGVLPGLIVIAYGCAAANFLLIPHGTPEEHGRAVLLTTSFAVQGTFITYLLARRTGLEGRLRDMDSIVDLALGAVSEAVVAIDASSRVLYLNPAGETMFGWSLVDLKGRSVTHLMPPALRDRHLQGVRTYLRTGHRTKPWSGIQTTAQRRDGSRFAATITYFATTTKPPRFYAIIREDTDADRGAQ